MMTVNNLIIKPQIRKCVVNQTNRGTAVLSACHDSKKIAANDDQ